MSDSEPKPLPPRRIGLYGGTFDPVHLAHLIAAQDALEQLRLDIIYFVPAYQSPFKPGRKATGAEHRLEMLRLALQDSKAEPASPGFAILDTEILRAEPSYAVDTVEDIRAAHPSAELFFLIGEDHLPTLGLWHRCKDLWRMITFAVQTRHSFDPGATAATPATLLGTKADAAALSFAALPTELPKSEIAASVEQPGVIRLPNSRHVDISATEIRRRVQMRLPIHFLVPPAVASYIAAHRLYQD